MGFPSTSCELFCQNTVNYVVPVIGGGGIAEKRQPYSPSSIASAWDISLQEMFTDLSVFEGRRRKGLDQCADVVVKVSKPKKGTRL